MPWREGAEVVEECVSQVELWMSTEAGNVYDWIARALDGSLEERAALFTGRPAEKLIEILGLDHGLADLGIHPHDDPGASAELQVVRDLSPSVPTEIGSVLHELSER